jgi:integrase
VVRDGHGRVVTERKKTRRHPDNGGSREAKRWRAVWEGANGKEASKAFAKKSDAEKYATAMEADTLRGIRYADPRRGAITVREYGETKFMPAMLHLRPNSADTYASHLKTHVYPALGGRQMGSVTRTDVQNFVTVVSGRLAPSTTETVYAVLRAMMQAAVTDDPQVIVVSPCTRIRLPRVEKRVLEPLPAAAVIALHRAISPRYRVMVALCAGLGLREGEAFGLTVPRVDFLRRRVHVLSQGQRGQLAAPLKTTASTRVIPADDWVLNEISEHIRQFGTGAAESIVTNRLGRMPRRSAFGDSWRSAVAAAGLPKGTRVHDLRHFYASTLIAANLNPKVIQARLGHATISETMDTYGHLFPDSEELGRGAIDSALGAHDAGAAQSDAASLSQRVSTNDK